LVDIGDVVEEIQKKGRISGVISAPTIAKKIKALKETMFNETNYMKVIIIFSTHYSWPIITTL